MFSHFWVYAPWTVNKNIESSYSNASLYHVWFFKEVDWNGIKLKRRLNLLLRKNEATSIVHYPQLVLVMESWPILKAQKDQNNYEQANWSISCDS